MRKFEEIVVHERCRRTLEEFKLYSWKKDRQTGEIMPIVVGEHDHCIDSLRYSLSNKIRSESHSVFLGECLD